MRTLAIVAVALVLPSAAAGTIVPQKEMGGVRLGMTRAAVERVLGEPLLVRAGSNDFGPYTELRYPHRILVVLQGRRTVTAIVTTGRSERTARGVGVGSTEAEVVSNVAGARCETVVGVRSCHVGTFAAGRRVTDFLLRNGRVARVTVGIVID